METTRAHVRAIGDGAIVEVTFDAVTIKPRIGAVATAQDNKFSATQATLNRTVCLRDHCRAWVRHARTIGNNAGDGVMWLMTAQPGANAVSVREMMLAMQCATQLAGLHVGVLMERTHRDAFVQHWSSSDDESAVDWGRTHMFTNVTGLHTYVASRGAAIKHVCMVSGSMASAVSDMWVHDDAKLHAVVHDGSFVYSVPPEWPMAMVHNDMPMLAAAHGTASVQTRRGNNACSAVEMRQETPPVAEQRMRLLYVSKFCDSDNEATTTPVQWLRELLRHHDAATAMDRDPLMLSLVLRAASAHVPHRGPPRLQRRRNSASGTSVISPHLCRSVTQQFTD